MSLKVIIITLISAFSLANINLTACSVAPPVDQWGSSKNGAFEFRSSHRTAEISVYKKGDRSKVLWKVDVKSLTGLYSTVMLNDAGDMLVHIKGNHQVKKISDTAVEIFRKNGDKAEIAASVFINKLVDLSDQTMDSTEARQRWLKRVLDLSKNQISVINAAGTKKTIPLEDLAFK